MMSQTSVGASGHMSHPFSPMSHPWGLNSPQTHLLQRNAALHNQGMSKSLSWTDGDPSTSTPTHPSHQRRSSPCPSPSSPSSLGGIISPPPPSLRSSVSSYSLGSGKGRKVMPKVDNESLIDLDIDEKDKTTVSVLEEFDPLIEHKEDEDELYWTSRESTNSTSFYDSYDPFSYMADRAAEEISSPTTAEAADEADTDLPALPPKHKKIGIVRPLPEVSAAELSRRKTVARNYENIVKEDATFFKGIGVAKTRSVARDAEVLAFTDMVRQIRSKYEYSNLLTNPGLVLAARLEAKYPESTELKLVVFPKLVNNLLEPSTPVLFTANVLTELDQIIAKVAIELDLNMDNCSDFVLQVQGKAEYLQGGSLDQYEYVHHCYKYDRDVKLTLVHKDLVDRGLARSEEDDIEDSELSYDQISPLDKAKTLSHEDLKTLLEFLQKEAERITNTARTLVNCTEKNVIQSLNPRGMLQAVKAVCAKLGSVETIDLSEALEKFKQACVKYDCMKGNEDPAGKLRPEIVEVVGERYAMVTFKKVASEGFMQNAEDIKHCLKAITEKVYSLIRTYSRTFRVDFSLEEIDTLFPGELKDSSSVKETLLARIGCVHRLNPSWEFLDYRLDLRVYHGTMLIREAHSSTFQKPEHSHQQLHSTVTFNTWIDVKSLPVSIIPLEARLVMNLVGRRKDPENKEADIEMEIGWTAIQMYSIDKHLSQGSYLLALWPMEVTQQIGPAPDSSSHPQADSCPLLSLELLDLGGPVVYPDLDPRLPQSQDTTLDCLDFNTREQLVSLCEQDILTFYKRSTLEREILWEKRFYLRNTPGALPKVLLSVQSWDPDTLKDLYGLLNTWPKPDIADTLQLFLPIFPDSEVRRRAVEWLEEETTDRKQNQTNQSV
ncbi:phosphatidylinositol 4-phosphate 3-kinase C2 domain-containing subunit beta [Eurytemora carolleeae]|uniref:phosphatidylinositol 4-phosphate 3-kinase C2 domain-containing subunit beta n=1 Tax=Eurytemora carolleeae TaxID=1294199 RepID=UPI000C78C66E|nr:phosphatidylinositol 4-phosphate 3-kinase C2 domain-containing subunit beta [Eurytemora carolleeae]|eukprot:XP_023349681.1 phosphatidylinositol 4-phosphate 3-kinase C2 domain-containing subunit beta-like [Eurytemora affinis]